MKSSELKPYPRFPHTPLDTITPPFQRLIRNETVSGAVLLLATGFAIGLANSSLGVAFESLWTSSAGLRIGSFVWDYPLRHWINEGLMTLFFFVVGLEIKRELICGESSVPGAAALPAAAALGGMLIPAVIYLALGSGSGSAAGWGAVMATDTAFVVGCLALLGRRVPRSLRVFVLCLAIIDDIGAIVVIAFGYGNGFDPGPFAAAMAGLALVLLMQWLGVRQMLAYWCAGLWVWVALHESGVHPTVAGLVLGLLTPATPWVEVGQLKRFLEWGRRTVPPAFGAFRKQGSTEARRKLALATLESISPDRRLTYALHHWSAFAILPLFAFANAGIKITASNFSDPIIIATAAGLVLGKPLGIVVFTRLAVALRLAQKPRELSWRLIAAAGSVCGIGFTMSLYIASLAFEGEALHAAKLGVLVASLISGVSGMAALYWVSAKRPKVT